MSEEYTKMLDKAMAKLPRKVGTGERFEIPEIEGVGIGNRTIIRNFNAISQALNRDPHHLLRFLSKEMATAATFDGSRAIFQGRFTVESIRRLLGIYAQRYVICPICKRPDTKISKEERFYFLVCEACGAKSSLMSI
jgi:translation initiation factor 2 subunit 2